MKTNTTTAKAQPYFSARQVYDELMKRIEPDLMTENLAHLDEKYAGETQDERKMRMEHYAIAFQIFDEALQEFGVILKSDMRALEKEVMNIARSESAAKDISAMKTIEQSLDSDS